MLSEFIYKTKLTEYNFFFEDITFFKKYFEADDM